MKESLMSTNGKRKADSQTRQDHQQNKKEETPNEHKPINSVRYIPTLIIFDILPRVDVPYLPTPIISEILSRVEITTLFNSRLVCKTWADLISTPEFAQLHLSRSPTSCLIKCLKEECQQENFHLFDLEYPFNLSNKLTFIPNINLPNAPLEFYNSINGLILLCQYESSSTRYFVCNPVLKEYITLPKFPNAKRIFHTQCALGFSHTTNQYKVVVYVCNVNSENGFSMIYTLGEGSWRSIEYTPYPIRGNISYNAFLNGAVHWIGKYPKCSFICCFDFETEQFRKFDKPSDFGPLKCPYDRGMTVGVINGNLSICDFGYTMGESINIWVMKEYGVKDSWTKDFAISNIINVPYDEYDDSNYFYEPIVFTSNGNFLMLFKYGFIQIYDARSKTFVSEMQIFGVNSDFQAIAHTPSLISLKDVAKGENLKVLGSN